MDRRHLALHGVVKTARKAKPDVEHIHIKGEKNNNLNPKP